MKSYQSWTWALVIFMSMSLAACSSEADPNANPNTEDSDSQSHGQTSQGSAPAQQATPVAADRASDAAARDTPGTAAAADFDTAEVQEWFKDIDARILTLEELRDPEKQSPSNRSPKYPERVKNTYKDAIPELTYRLKDINERLGAFDKKNSEFTLLPEAKGPPLLKKRQEAFEQRLGSIERKMMAELLQSVSVKLQGVDKGELSVMKANVLRLKENEDSPSWKYLIALMALGGLALGSFGTLLSFHNRNLLVDLRKALMKVQQDFAQSVFQTKNSTTHSAASKVDRTLSELKADIKTQGDQLNTRGKQLDGIITRLEKGEQQARESTEFINQTLTWLGQLQLREAEKADGGMNESQRADLIAKMENHRTQLRAHAEHIEPLVHAMAQLKSRFRERASTPEDVNSRVEMLYDEIARFRRVGQDLDAYLNMLQRGSFGQRQLQFEAQKSTLELKRQAGQVSLGDYVLNYRKLLDTHFASRSNGSEDTPPPDEDELTQLIQNVADFLMDWFSNFAQFQSRLQTAYNSGASLDPALTGEMEHVETVARHVLDRFDIQPEKIIVGKTAFDPRLYVSASVRQSSQYPVNTVIEIYRAGFRRTSTGEVLRRPQVVVSGTALS